MRWSNFPLVMTIRVRVLRFFMSFLRGPCIILVLAIMIWCLSWIVTITIESRFGLLNIGYGAISVGFDKSGPWKMVPSFDVRATSSRMPRLDLPEVKSVGPLLLLRFPLWPLFFLVALVKLTIGSILRRRRICWALSGRCARCGYPIAKSNTTLCPECGHFNSGLGNARRAR